MCRDKGKDSEKGNHAATHLFNQESMCRGQGSGAEEVVRAATHHFTRKTVYREHRKREKDRCDAAIHHFGKKSCVATREGSRSLTAVQRYTISGREPCIASTERGRSTDAVQRHTLKMQFACINYDIQKNLCTFQIFLTCIFSSHFCFSLKVIPRQALPSAKKHEKDLSFMLVGRRRNIVPIEKGLYPRDNLSIHRCI